MTDKQNLIAHLLEIANKLEQHQDLDWTDRHALVLVLNIAYSQLQQRVDNTTKRRTQNASKKPQRHDETTVATDYEKHLRRMEEKRERTNFNKHEDTNT